MHAACLERTLWECRQINALFVSFTPRGSLETRFSIVIIACNLPRPIPLPRRDETSVALLSIAAPKPSGSSIGIIKKYNRVLRAGFQPMEQVSLCFVEDNSSRPVPVGSVNCSPRRISMEEQTLDVSCAIRVLFQKQRYNVLRNKPRLEE